MAVPKLLSPTEVRILSELRQCRRGTSPTDLAKRARLPRPTLYVLLRRLAQRKCVTSHRQAQGVIYAITKRGAEARVRYARKVGLKP